jgi:predicted Zn-dependent protease
MAHEEELKQAIALIKSGMKQDSIPILKGILKTDRNNERAWLWLSACVEKTEDKKYCLGEVLRINPNNEGAKIALGRLEPAPAVDDIVQSQVPDPVRQLKQGTLPAWAYVLIILFLATIYIVFMSGAIEIF